ncbi:uncharacterized protein [Apostichopus japonicus]|uniref:uncharacterized protein n=1 Tax=Stichopus japonicus TaxID=307972 RepID=UPI003AB58C05
MGERLSAKKLRDNSTFFLSILICSYMIYLGLFSGEGYDQPLNYSQLNGSSKPILHWIRKLEGTVPYKEANYRAYAQTEKEEIQQVVSAFHEFKQYSNGSILRDRHLVAESLPESQSRVRPIPLNKVKVGQMVNFSVEIGKNVSKVNGYSVLAVGENHIFVANQTEYSDDRTIVNFTVVPTLPGVYNLFIEEFDHVVQLQLPGSPFNLVVEAGDPADAMEIGRTADKLPSCHAVPLTRPSWLGGKWITRNLASKKRGVLRSGWVFQLDWCTFDVFTTDDLAMAAESPSPKKIVILGSSVERGIFFSLVDVLLTKEEKYNLSDSDFAKCWGYAQVKVGNLQLVYQDFRIENDHFMNITDDGKSDVICHDEKVAKLGSYDFFGDGLRFLREYLFAADPLPDILVVPIRTVVQLELLLKAIPSSWSGTMYPLYNFKCKDRMLYTKDGLEKSYQLAEEFLSLDGRVQLIDGFGLGSGMRHNTESSPLIMKSNHWHKWCNEFNGEMRVCGNPTAMIAQILFGKVIAPEGKEAWLKTDESKITFPRKITVCQDCPASLLPFHIKVNPDLKCYISSEGIRKTSKAKFLVWDGTLCPAECMRTEPIDTLDTQSGSVNVRKCNINLL